MATLDGKWTYQYNDAGELTHAVFASNDPSTTPNQDLQYVYDAVGNRTETIENGVVTTYTVNDMNQYTQVGNTTYTYDANGNLIKAASPTGTTTYAYNEANELISAASPQGTTQYAYDAMGNMVQTNVNGGITDYVVDPSGLGNVVGTYNASGGLIANYTYGLGLVSQTTGASTFYYTFDGTGNTAQMTTSTGAVADTYRYDPFGVTLAKSDTVAKPFQYVAQLGVMTGTNGLDSMRAREYSTGVGRFTTQDPIGVLGGD